MYPLASSVILMIVSGELSAISPFGSAQVSPANSHIDPDGSTREAAETTFNKCRSNTAENPAMV
jgi:hypothetical protein